MDAWRIPDPVAREMIMMGEMANFLEEWTACGRDFETWIGWSIVSEAY